MNEFSENPTAILLLTVWSEPGTFVLRARVTRTPDVRSSGASDCLSGRDAVLASVREWLDMCEIELRR
ncbi:hypothetical protein ACIPSA_25715 [Streptomyces sp. NPDC086549]|uniref:hypothetical protein n=1 Tax=Streptomyces sp. NPDC086549 TaxID=3365752 RepID=UPI0037F9C615